MISSDRSWFSRTLRSPFVLSIEARLETEIDESGVHLDPAPGELQPFRRAHARHIGQTQ
jgi:hypothetical protein